MRQETILPQFENFEIPKTPLFLFLFKFYLINIDEKEEFLYI